MLGESGVMETGGPFQDFIMRFPSLALSTLSSQVSSSTFGARARRGEGRGACARTDCAGDRRQLPAHLRVPPLSPPRNVLKAVSSKPKAAAEPEPQVEVRCERCCCHGDIVNPQFFLVLCLDLGGTGLASLALSS